jgi:ankyrin repeat protein
MTPQDAAPTPQKVANAIFTNNCNLLEQLLDAGDDINAVVNSYGATPLTYSIGENNTEAALILIQRGAALGKTGSGIVPLVKAARFGNENLCRVLLDAGAGVDEIDVSHKTALFEAVNREFPAICRLLIEGGADVHLGTKSFASPLHVAAVSKTNRSDEVVRALVAGGADPSRLSTPGQVGKYPLASAYELPTAKRFAL